MIALRDYQSEAIHAVDDGVQCGIRRPLIALPTGTGKTVVFASLISQRPGRSLVLVHRDELIRQAYGKLKEIAPALSVGIVKAEEDEHAAPCVIASVQTLSRESRLQRLTPDFGTIVVDEAHHAVAESYRRILDYCGAFAESGPLTLGVTATPMRGDDVGLDAVFQEIVYSRTILEMIQAGYLADLRALQIHLKADFHQLHIRAGDLIDGEVEEMLLEANAPALVVQAYLAHARSRKALLFTPTVHLAHLMAATFQDAGVPAEAVDGSTPLEDRRAILRRLHTGETRIVANCGVLTESFDEPSVDCIIVARPTKSRTLFTQMIGRGTRVYPGKEDCLILDVVGASTRHDLASVASLTGLPLDALKTGASVSEAVAEIAAWQERQRLSGEVEARTVDLFRSRPLHWLSMEGSFTLSLGEHGWVLLSPESGPESEHWTAAVISPAGSRTVLASDLSLAYAQGTAEDYARNAGVGALVNPRAAWRQKPASDKQQWLLRRLHVAFSADLTMGEAADLISHAKMREAVLRAA